ncbi:pentatricopeptide repeat-containing protein At4g18975, chloroplastic [Quercus suber]|uniref:Pentatricopeptide repeat-containing protein n=1 Tax=Quercus suber TaxID=58331 RepID=A0AAW0KFE6_QUESU|nr:pentatricopeptide repeat-containing protein At4g18975, chloroplastic isoform X1 [Quercus suber]XP_023913803.1 pentatricopeptide repeat-containing protein At4g18975, chloroplastic isoform X2 [Quercus suber]XP_023913805.1 pentatricopeptide repeat-containing protein At4g18975, chloroplastic isoform X3 [Quercus suber]XP_023913806.1 pentatricopeptide repeat-containing protein At4g18975, chloroplastic isoform X2 [Quercus suber]
MWRSSTMSSLLHRLAQRGAVRAQFLNSSYSTMLLHQSQISNRSTTKAMASFQDECDSPAKSQFPDQNAGGVQGRQIGENVSRKDKINFLVNTLLDIKDSKEAVYGALDAWVAWEQNFPIASLKRALLVLEKEQQWHRIIQVIKWMLSKGQGTTMGTYGQLIRALDMDHRAEEAHKVWVQKLGMDLHSVPWQLCRLMISVYHRNNMLEDLVKLFKNLEAFDRKPPEKSIVQRVADAYEMLGLLEEKQRVLEKYNDLFTENKSPKKGRISPYKKKNK